MSYALGLDPRSPEPWKYPSSGFVTMGSERYLSFTFRRRKHAVDLSYRVKVTGDLLDWVESTTVFGEIIDNRDGTETITIRDSVPVSAGGPRFMQLVVDQVPEQVTTYSQWLAGEFTPAERADPAVTGPHVDLDGNGYGTFMSYALGLDPRVPEPSRYPVSGFVTDGGHQYLSLTFRRRKDALDLIYRVLVSGDLVQWVETTILVGAVTDNGDRTETLTIRDTAPVGASRSRFMRLEAELD
jgi:hypothetical protein